MPLKATVVLNGGSLLHSQACSDVEFDAHPIDLSQGGIRLSLGLQAHWATFSPQREIELFLVNDEGGRIPFRATVVRFLKDSQELSLQFQEPLGHISEFVQKASLH